MDRESHEPTPDEIDHFVDDLNETIDEESTTQPPAYDPEGADYCTLQYLTEPRYRPWNWTYPA